MVCAAISFARPARRPYGIQRRTWMSTKNDFSAEDWKAIMGAPVAAGLYITLSDPSGPLGITKEAMAVGKSITDSAAAGAPEIVQAIAESVKQSGGRPEFPDVPKTDPAQMKVALLGTVQNAIGIRRLSSLAPVGCFESCTRFEGRGVPGLRRY
jgi:hypothetical protein